MVRPGETFEFHGVKVRIDNVKTLSGGDILLEVTLFSPLGNQYPFVTILKKGEDVRRPIEALCRAFMDGYLGKEG